MTVSSPALHVFAYGSLMLPASLRSTVPDISRVHHDDALPCFRGHPHAARGRRLTASAAHPLGMDTAVEHTTVIVTSDTDRLVVAAHGPAALAHAAGEAYRRTGWAHGHARVAGDGSAEVTVLYSDMRLAHGDPTQVM